MVMIDDLNNEMLREIFCRLPCYPTALGCKTVSKRWCSIISDPLFLTQGFLTNRQVIQKEPSFIFLLIMNMWGQNYATAMVAPPCFQRTTLQSPFLSLPFLPHHSIPVATFKDLILSYGIVNPSTGFGMFYICNPLTKQWMVLPPSQFYQKHFIWAALTYHLDGRGFRVIVSHSRPKDKGSSIIINLLIYISEICEWRNIDVTLQLKPPSRYYSSGYFKGIVCKWMVCIQDGSLFCGLNPFDVTDTYCGTLTAIDLSLPDQSAAYTFLESGGNLVAFQEETCISFGSNHRGRLIQYFPRPWRIWKCDLGLGLENDKHVHQWELISQHNAFSEVNGSMLHDRINSGSYDRRFSVVGVHPTNQRLLYLIRLGDDDITQNRLILFDTKSKTLEPLTTTLPPHEICTSYKLDIPSWPTPIPMQFLKPDKFSIYCFQWLCFV